MKKAVKVRANYQMNYTTTADFIFSSIKTPPTINSSMRDLNNLIWTAAAIYIKVFLYPIFYYYPPPPKVESRSAHGAKCEIIIQF